MEKSQENKRRTTIAWNLCVEATPKTHEAGHNYNVKISFEGHLPTGLHTSLLKSYDSFINKVFLYRSDR